MIGEFFFKESWFLRACLVLLTRKFESWSINPKLINTRWQFSSLNSGVEAYSLLGSSDLCGERGLQTGLAEQGRAEPLVKNVPIANQWAAASCSSHREQSQLQDHCVHCFQGQGVDFGHRLSQDSQNFSAKCFAQQGLLSLHSLRSLRQNQKVWIFKTTNGRHTC